MIDLALMEYFKRILRNFVQIENFEGNFRRKFHLTSRLALLDIPDDDEN